MARRRSRTQRRSFTPPPLSDGGEDLPAHLADGNADALWSAGEAAEEEFDYEAARQLYRAATRRAGAEIAGFSQRYAAFLVERYGQFEEVAAWLDDPSFDPVAGLTPPEDPALARFVAVAATETNHPRALDLDAMLAEAFGDPDSLARVASRHAEAGDREAAVALLERHQRRLAPDSDAANLLAALRAKGKAETESAMQPAVTAMDGGQLDVAGRLLAELRGEHGKSATFRSLAARLSDLRKQDQVAAIAAEITSLLVADRLADALARANDWQQLDLAGADKVTEIEALIAARERLRAAQSLSTERPGTSDAWSRLLRIAGSIGLEFTAPSDWSDDYATALLARKLGMRSAGASELVVAATLPALAEQGDFVQLSEALNTLGPAASQLPHAKAAAEVLHKHQRSAQEAVESSALVRAQTFVSDGDWPAADEIAIEYRAKDVILASRWRELNRAIEEAREVAESAQRLRTILEAAVSAGQWLEAAALLDQFELVADDPDDVQRLGAAIEVGRKGLVAKPVPPFGLKVSDDPIALGVHGDRLAVVQGTLWLNVNLQTRGLAPFQLPAAYAIAARPTARIKAKGDVLRLVGVSEGRLVVVEQRSGEKPEVTAVANISELLRGEKLAAVALEPWAREWHLLSAGSGKKPGRLVRVDPETLRPISGERHKPSLLGICSVENGDGALASTNVEQRIKRGFAMAWLDGGGPPRATWTQEDLAEPVAAPRRAIAWPEQDRVFVSYSCFDPFEPGATVTQPSLLVLRDGRPVFASSDLRRRFAPIEKITVDHAWTLDAANGRLWFAALPRQDADGEDALLLGVNAMNLRADKPRSIDGVARIIALLPLDDGAAALCRLHDGKLAVARATASGSELQLRVDKLPL